jgi:hypothetical protein
MRASVSLRSKFELKVKAKNEKQGFRLVEEMNSEMRHGVPSPTSQPPTVFLDESPNPKDDDIMPIFTESTMKPSIRSESSAAS